MKACCTTVGLLPEGPRSDAAEPAPAPASTMTLFGSASTPAPAPRRWDICVVAQPLELTAKEEEKLDPVQREARLAHLAVRGKQRKDTYAKLRRAGIDLHFFTDETKDVGAAGVDSVSQYVLLSIPDELLKETAARIGLEKQLKPIFVEGVDTRTKDDFMEYTPYREYTKEAHDDFAPDHTSPDCEDRARERAAERASGSERAAGPRWMRARAQAAVVAGTGAIVLLACAARVRECS